MSASGIRTAIRRVVAAPEHLRRACPKCGAGPGDDCSPYRPGGVVHRARVEQSDRPSQRPTGRPSAADRQRDAERAAELRIDEFQLRLRALLSGVDSITALDRVPLRAYLHVADPVAGDRPGQVATRVAEGVRRLARRCRTIGDLLDLTLRPHVVRGLLS